jgi:hypothetical protein
MNNLGLTVLQANAAGTVMPPSQEGFGKSYAEWSAAWLKWVCSIPAATNPILDNTGAYAATNQMGKVWFLAGTTGAGVVPPVERDLTVPEGTALFFPIVNYFWLNLPELGDPKWSRTQAQWVNGFLKNHVDTAAGFSLEIDGQAVQDVDNLRTLSNPPVKVQIPQEDLFKLTVATTDGGFGLPPGRYGPAVADGYWAFVEPLEIGTHSIHFTGGFTADGFSLDVTYRIVVKPKRTDRVHNHN